MKGFKAKIDYALKHNMFLNKIFNIFFSAFFKIIGCFVKIDKKSILFSGLNKKYNDSPKAIYEKIMDNPFFADYKFYWSLDDFNTSIPGNCIKIKPDSWSYFITALKCKYWIACVNIERSLHFKKKKTIYLNTWHGTPIKTVGNSASKRADFNFSNIDFFCCAGEYEKAIYIKDFRLKPSSLINTGLPRNDALYSVNEEEIGLIRERIGIPVDKKVILYAPTWRDSNDKGKTYSIKPPIDLSKWEKLLGDNYVILLRTHPFTNQLLGVEFNSFVRDFSGYPSMNDLLKVADILISDYSATIFDYSILERPIVCFGYDCDSYAKDRGLYLDIEKELPSGVMKNEDEVLSKILSINYKEESLKTKRFKDKYLKYGGKAATECIKAVFGIEE